MDEKMTEFDRWTYAAKDPTTGMPFVTTLLYRVCEQDDRKFEEALRILKAAFEGGQAAAATPVGEDA